MTRLGRPIRVMVGAGLAPALAFPSIRLRIAFANKAYSVLTHVATRYAVPD